MGATVSLHLNLGSDILPLSLHPVYRSECLGPTYTQEKGLHKVTNIRRLGSMRVILEAVPMVLYSFSYFKRKLNHC